MMHANRVEMTWCVRKRGAKIDGEHEMYAAWNGGDTLRNEIGLTRACILCAVVCFRGDFQ